MDLLGVAVGGRGIEECSFDPCAGLACSNGGSCQVMDGSEPVCLCTLGFTGPTCDFGKFNKYFLAIPSLSLSLSYLQLWI